MDGRVKALHHSKESVNFTASPFTPNILHLEFFLVHICSSSMGKQLPISHKFRCHLKDKGILTWVEVKKKKKSERRNLNVPHLIDLIYKKALKGLIVSLDGYLEVRV